MTGVVCCLSDVFSSLSAAHDGGIHLGLGYIYSLYCHLSEHCFLVSRAL